MTFSFSRWQAEARRIGGDEGVTISRRLPLRPVQDPLHRDRLSPDARHLLSPDRPRHPEVCKAKGNRGMLFSELIFKMLTNVYRWKVEKRDISMTGCQEAKMDNSSINDIVLVSGYTRIPDFSLLTAPVIQRFAKLRGIEVCCFQNLYLKC